MSGAAASGDADSSWKAYVPLWGALIKGEGLSDQDASLGSQVHAWSQPLYDALLTAVLDALRNLDLEYHQAADMPEVPDGGAAAPLEITDQVQSILASASIDCYRPLHRLPAAPVFSTQFRWLSCLPCRSEQVI